MKNLRNSIQIFCLLGFSFIAFSCENDAPAVVEQDTSWQIDQRLIDEDIRVQLGIDPYTDLVYVSGRNLLSNLEASNDLKKTTIVGGGELEYTVKATKIMKEDVVVKLVYDAALMKEFPADISGKLAFPEASYTTANGVIKAGSYETTLKIKLDPGKIDKAPGYAAAFKLVMEGQHKNLAIAKTRASLFLKLDLTIQMDNIDSSNKPIEGEMFNKTLTFDSNQNRSEMNSFNDGSLNNNWWTTDIKHFILINLPAKTAVKGIKLDTNSDDSYMLKKVKVYVDYGDGVWTANGTYNRQERGAVAYIAFKEPANCVKIRLEAFNAFDGGNGVDVNEINLFK